MRECRELISKDDLDDFSRRFPFLQSQIFTEEDKQLLQVNEPAPQKAKQKKVVWTEQERQLF